MGGRNKIAGIYDPLASALNQHNLMARGWPTRDLDGDTRNHFALVIEKFKKAFFLKRQEVVFVVRILEAFVGMIGLLPAYPLNEILRLRKRGNGIACAVEFRASSGVVEAKVAQYHNVDVSCCQPQVSKPF